MQTILSDHYRKARLDQAIINLETEGYEVVARAPCQATLRRVTYRLFLRREERVTLEVDPFGRILRRAG